MRNIATILICCLVSLSASADLNCKEPMLSAVINDYFNKEITGDWEFLYGYRRLKYQRTVPFEVYKKHMAEDTRMVWLESFDIKGIENNKNSCVAAISIIEGFDPRIFPNIAGRTESVNKSQMDVITIWIKESEKWVLLDSTRWHQSLSGRIVLDDL